MLSKIKSWFSPKPKYDPEFRNLKHRDYASQVEPAFECQGTQYYRFKEEARTPYGRYKYVSQALYEVNLRMDLPTLRAYVEGIKKHIDGSTGTINLTKVVQILTAIESRIELQFTPETARKLATIVYFDETEDLTDMDFDYAEKKAKIWEREGGHHFFLMRPMDELLGLKGYSQDSLTEYISEVTDVLAVLNSVTQKALSENTDNSKQSK